MAFPCHWCGMKIYKERDQAIDKIVVKDARDPDHPVHNCSVEKLIRRHDFHDSNMRRIRIFLNSVNKRQGKGGNDEIKLDANPGAVISVSKIQECPAI